MKTIERKLSSDLKEIELIMFADEHIGDVNCDMKRLEDRIKYVAEKDNAYCILNGDILDYASRSSIGDIETREYNIMEQLDRAIELFSPIKGKILGITSGNHEARGYKKEGFDISRVIAKQLGIEDLYSPDAAYIFLRFGKSAGSEGRHGRKVLYKIFVNHGSGGGRKEGSKAIRLADMANVCDADIYIHSHTHLPMIMKQGYFRPSDSTSSIQNVTRLFINTSSNLDYGGYSASQEYKPNSKDTPVIFLDGTKKEMRAEL